MTNKRRFSVTMDAKLVSEIDKKRGLIPRAAYINEKMKEIMMPDRRPSNPGITATP